MPSQGLWTAFYGDHGPEILHVWFDETLQSHNGAPVFEGRNARPRLVGCKVTGDPNVPATQWSFVAQVTGFLVSHSMPAAAPRCMSMLLLLLLLRWHGSLKRVQ